MATKRCPFCHKEINADCTKCPYCGHLLVEHISSPYRSNRPTDQVSATSVERDTILDAKNKKVDYRKFIKYSVGLLILFFVIFSVLNNRQLSNKNNSINTTRINNPTENTKYYNSLPNGTIIYSSPYYLTGLGKLKIDNGTNYDAIVKLINTSIDKSVYTVYIKAKNSFEIDEILDGRYALLFMHGKNWDSIHQTFLVDKSYSKFKDDFNFITKRVAKYNNVEIDYAIYEVTLYPVPGGNAQTNDISKYEFNKY